MAADPAACTRHGRGGGRAVLIDLRTVAQTGSTNADLLLMAQAGSAEGLWLRAEQQTAGRGRQGRDWVSPRGNLYASTLVRLRPSDPSPPTLALVAAVALEEAVSLLLAVAHRDIGARLSIKWPNDLLLGNAKLAGILLERAGDAVVIGFGVNCAEAPDLPGREVADLGSGIDPAVLVETLAEIFARWLERWRGKGLAPVRARWTERAHPAGTALVARLSDGSAVEGLFGGLDEGGALRLRLADGRAHVIHAADVFLL